MKFRCVWNTTNDPHQAGRLKVNTPPIHITYTECPKKGYIFKFEVRINSNNLLHLVSKGVVSYDQKLFLHLPCV